MDRNNTNKIEITFREGKRPILSAYFTAGFPNLEDTVPAMLSLQEAGADLIEVGIPFSDPVADGPTIQQSNKIALDNGINLRKILDQVKSIREEINIPVLLMGYLNPIYQFGIEAFCKECQAAGVSGLIIPDLPIIEYQELYQDIFEKYNIYNIFLITPETTEERIKKIDSLSKGFIYMVSSSSTTGARKGLMDEQLEYFERINTMDISCPRLIGFGISDRGSFEKISKYAHGAIIGSAIINVLRESTDIRQDLITFISGIKGLQQTD